MRENRSGRSAASFVVSHAGEVFLRPLADLLGGEVLLVGGDGPLMTEGIADPSMTVAPEGIHGGHEPVL
jgi:hypothetical protein